MALEPGSRLGHYDVTDLLGEGGRGQVWQATDTQLNRQVALKILPDAFAADPDRLARFTREAQILASLNHPNIGSIYGLEEAEGVKAASALDHPNICLRPAGHSGVPRPVAHEAMTMEKPLLTHSLTSRIGPRSFHCLALCLCPVLTACMSEPVEWIDVPLADHVYFETRPLTGRTR